MAVNSFEVQSHVGPYRVAFFGELPLTLDVSGTSRCHYLVDANVARLYRNALAEILVHETTIIIEANETNKSLERLIPVIETLLKNRIRRGDALVAIGGGIIQDITCFVAATLLRGIAWRFVPTTLLAQADSCIGSKSSINLGTAKNILGTFTPPSQVMICTKFLETLEKRDVHSGIGEILKVHAIESVASFDRVAECFEQLFVDRQLLETYIVSALRIKKRFVEADEFDKNIRNIFNYGHSFGHAIESATQFVVPHGIAVSMGMDLANYVAAQSQLTDEDHYLRMHAVLAANYSAYARTPFRREDFFEALLKDKKNTASQLGLVLPIGKHARPERVYMEPDTRFRTLCASFLEAMQQ